jgi:hypothetical protein
MAGESYSAWFIRFLFTFRDTDNRPNARDPSRVRWLEVFVEAFLSDRTVDARSERVVESEAADDEESQYSSRLRDEVEDEEASSRAQEQARSTYTQSEEASREQPRYRAHGDGG